MSDFDTQKKLEKRIQYHEGNCHDLECEKRAIWQHYENETRKGLDEYQLNTLLMWRKENIHGCDVLIKAHTIEAEWLRGICD